MRLAVITDLYGLKNVDEMLRANFQVTYLSNCSSEEFLDKCLDTEIIFTNPNNSQFSLSTEILSKLNNLKIITTASTGTVHIDTEFCSRNNIEIISIKDEINTLQKITSTAEHAVLLTLTLLRKTHLSVPSVWSGSWDYREFTGRQVNQLSVGTVGLGRLGAIYAQIMCSMGADVYFFDPYVSSSAFKKSDTLREMASKVDVIAINCHVTSETIGLIDRDVIFNGKFNYLINTARGEIVDEQEILNRLKADRNFYYATDVISNEQDKKVRTAMIDKFKNFRENVVITPHQGGMTFDARSLAYSRASELLLACFGKQ